MSWILLSSLRLIIVCTIIHQASTSGVFELRLLSFDNEAGRDDHGKCCTGPSDAGGHKNCPGLCRPRFRVCLKEYQVKIDTTSPCTFGDVITTELDPNPSSEDRPLNGFDNAIEFPFPFTWPGTFSLIVEAWHGNQSAHSAVLLSRLTKQTLLNVSDQWTEDVHNSKYSTLKFEYRVTCKSNYYGKGCENLCRPRDDNFGHYSCSPMGEIVCLAGWTGDYCTKPQCLQGCDHGHCATPNKCECLSGWGGPLCTECKRYPGCIQGTCTKPWECLCNEGWGGLFCNEDLNFCTNHKPCRNGGTCFNTGQGSYTCNCTSGYTGANCELPVHDCVRTPCLNDGHCLTLTNNINVTTSTCQCTPGYHGPRCETPSSHCIDTHHRCSNGGTCIVLDDGGHRCDCPPEFGGSDCNQLVQQTQQVSVCAPHNPCQNEGVCQEDSADNQFLCVCPVGYSGPRCETNGEHVVVIATLSTFVPLMVLVAVGAIVFLKQRRNREKERADEEARLQNEQNTAYSSFVKRGAGALIVDNAGNGGVGGGGGSGGVGCGGGNLVVGVGGVGGGGAATHIIRNSWGKCTNNVTTNVISSSPSAQYLSSDCGSDPSLLKRPSEKESKCVYVIEEHLNRPDTISANLFATVV